jgi:ketosteroid isomerase-like protein
MNKKILYTIIAAGISLSAFAQKSDNSTKSLLKADKSLRESIAKDGMKEAFKDFSSDDAVTFKPNPVSAKTYYSGQGDNKDLKWEPAYAEVSKSGDWGFITGPYVVDGSEKIYGQFLSIWKTDDEKWKLALDINTTTNKPLKKTVLQAVEPKEFYKPKFLGEKQMAGAREIIMTTEKTLNTTLKSYGVAAFSSFLNPDVRVLFPGREPVIGKDAAISFYHGLVDKINLKTTKVDKALGGDFAYSYGLATIDYKADLRESFNYVYIYERQPDHNWNLIVQVYVPAER